MLACKTTPAPPRPPRPPRKECPPNILDVHQAIINKDLPTLQRLTTSRPQPNTKCPPSPPCGLDLGAPVRGATALSLAVYQGQLGAVKLLIKAGAPIDKRSRDHLDRIETPIISAIRLGHRDIFEELLRAGASLHTPDFYNTRPLWHAVKEQRPAFVRTLLHHGAPLANPGGGGDNPLTVAMEYLGYKGRRDTALELVAAGIPLSDRDLGGRSPLHWALHHRDLTFVTFLVEAGVSLRPPEKTGGGEGGGGGDPQLLSTNQNSPFEWIEEKGDSDWLRDRLATPPSLLSQSRARIRDILVNRQNRDLRPLLLLLPLPPSLLSYLALERELERARSFPPSEM
ncbi:ankyrin repeat and SOCS box protein 12-like [Eriocheir sinensis]|uniref:ankyrin repeat and SOCS box protein 12-like n=1 Tax=Eriocheir sinensis TaxID=95602 RepID=UPI0021C7F447|nr:ankyrin repeat and SOCS box protein 12-like [Eriocheir sinensis]